MLGGEMSFGAGGWGRSPIEAILPVDCQLDRENGTLVLLLDTSTLDDAARWQREVVERSVDLLGQRDRFGVVYVDRNTGKAAWLDSGDKGLVEAGMARTRLPAALANAAIGKAENLDEALALVQAAFGQSTHSAVKQMVMLSDGKVAPMAAEIMTKLRASKVSVSTVVFPGMGEPRSAELKTLAMQSGGRYYEVRNVLALPRIFQKEARATCRSLIHEDRNGFRPRIAFRHPVLTGIQDELPPLTGLVETVAKRNAQTNVLLVAPVGSDERPLLATRTIGDGRTVAFTSDTGTRWSKAWTEAQHTDRLFSQIVRWSMQPEREPAGLRLAAKVEKNTLRLTLTPQDGVPDLDQIGDIHAVVVGPDNTAKSIELVPLGKDRLTSSFTPPTSGSYFVAAGAKGRRMARTLVHVPARPSEADQ
jgi:hypothetical protein